MPNYRIKRHLSVIGHSANVVELRWGVWNPLTFVISDDSESGHLFKLLKRLDGTVSAADLARQEGVSRAEVEALVDHLISIAVVETGPGSALDYYLDTCLPTASIPKVSERAKSVILVGDDDLVAAVHVLLEADKTPLQITVPPRTSEAVRQLRATDVTWQRHGAQFHEVIGLFETWRDSIVVSVSRIVNPLQARTLNLVAQAIGFPAIHAGIDGPFLMVGPTVLPKRSACYECFESRIVMNMRENAGYQSYKNALAEGNVQLAELPLLKPLNGLLASHVALETINLATTGGNFTINKALTIHVPTMEVCFHDVLRLPCCTSCGSVAEREDQELYIELNSLVADADAHG